MKPKKAAAITSNMNSRPTTSAYSQWTLKRAP
jgi:flagellar motility protein MotE (MotC chaperone)